jgi:hypothetical protein
MRIRATAAVAAILLATAGCSTTHGGGASPERTATMTSKPAAKSPSPTEPKATAAAKSCPPTRDVIVWTKVPGLPNSAQVVGNYNAATCETTFQWLKHSSPTTAGYCTEAAYASDNPGYNTAAEPARRLKDVQVAIGPAC